MSAITAFAAEGQNTQTIAYIGTDNLGNNNIIQLLWENGNWSQFDVLALLFQEHGGTPPPPRRGSPLTGYTFDAQNTFYLVYIDTDNNVQILKGHGSDWTVESPKSAPPAASNSALAGYAWESNKSQHVIYVDSTNHLRELYADWNSPPNSWFFNELTKASTPQSGSPLAGYAFENQATEHIIYIAQDNSIHELLYDGANWSDNNLTDIVKATQRAPGSALAAYVCEFENTQHVIYAGNDDNVHEIYWSRGWSPNNKTNLTSKTGAVNPIGNSGLAGYSFEAERTEHVIQIGSDGGIQELYYSGGEWKTNNLSNAAGSGATAPGNGSPLVGYVFTNQQTQHVIYMDIFNRAHELYWAENAWHPGEVST